MASRPSSRLGLGLSQCTLAIVSLTLALACLYHDERPFECIGSGSLCISHWGILMAPMAAFWALIASMFMLRLARRAAFMTPCSSVSAALDLQTVLVPVSAVVFCSVGWHAFSSGGAHESGRWMFGCLCALHQMMACVSAVCWLHLKAALQDEDAYSTKPPRLETKSFSLPTMRPGWYEFERGHHPRNGRVLSPIHSAVASERESSDAHSNGSFSDENLREARRSRRRVGERGAVCHHDSHAMNMRDTKIGLRNGGAPESDTPACSSFGVTGTSAPDVNVV